MRSRRASASRLAHRRLHRSADDAAVGSPHRGRGRPQHSGHAPENAVNPSMGAPGAASMRRTVSEACPEAAAARRLSVADAAGVETARRSRRRTSTRSASRQPNEPEAMQRSQRDESAPTVPGREWFARPCAAWTRRPEPPWTGLRRPREPFPPRDRHRRTTSVQRPCPAATAQTRQRQRVAPSRYLTTLNFARRSSLGDDGFGGSGGASDGGDGSEGGGCASSSEKIVPCPVSRA